MPTLFCPQCDELILDQPACAACGWQRPVATGAGAQVWRIELGRRLGKPSYPVIAAGRYCLSALDGSLIALDLGSGQIAWERSLADGHTAHALATDGERLFVGAVDAQPIPVPGQFFLALDARDGTLAWQYPTEAHSLSAAALVDDTLYFTTSDGLLHNVDTATAQRRWAVTHPTWGPEAPTAGAGVICVGGQGAELIGYAAADGTELWRFSSTDWFAGKPSIAGGRVFALCWDGYLYALDARTGQLLWKLKGERDKGFTTDPVAVDGQLFIGCRVYHSTGDQRRAGYALLALGAENGAEIWRFYTGRHLLVPPALVGDTMLIAVDDGSFYALDAASGAERWQTRLDERIVTQPQIAGDLVYVGGRHGTISALRWREAPAEELLPPSMYKQRGAHEQAAVAHALRGEFDEAAAIYAAMPGRHRESAQLYERAGQPGKAASLWEELGELRRARDCYRESGDLSRLAGILEQLGEPLQAARLYEEIGNREAAARLYEQSGDRVRAAELYDQIGRFALARIIWESLGQWERLVEDLIREGQQVQAAIILEQQRQLERAAELYEEAEQFQQALKLRAKLEHWERVAALGLRMGEYQQAAEAWGRLGHSLRAAEAYERAAQQSAATEPGGEERAAVLYEQAARLYGDVFEEERAATCRRQVRRYRRLPEVVVAGEAHEAFVEHEWNTLTLRFENTGYGPARDVAIGLRGEFDTRGNLKIAILPPKKLVSFEISTRPRHGQYGPKVPLDIVVRYEDERGDRYEVVQRLPVHVVRQGIEPGSVTPFEILISGDQLPRRPATLSQEEIDHQLELLVTHRRTLAHYLKQRAALGEAHTPPEVTHGIRAARDDIRQIKQILRGWGIAVEDRPDDEPSSSVA